MKRPLKSAPEIWKHASKFLERASEGDASEITRIVLKSPEAHFQKLSRASEGASRMHPPGLSFGASKRGGGGGGKLPVTLIKTVQRLNYLASKCHLQAVPASTTTGCTGPNLHRPYRPFTSCTQAVQAQPYKARTGWAV
jgi:hypothetical protein